MNHKDPIWFRDCQVKKTCASRSKYNELAVLLAFQTVFYPPHQAKGGKNLIIKKWKSA